VKFLSLQVTSCNALLVASVMALLAAECRRCYSVSGFGHTHCWQHDTGTAAQEVGWFSGCCRTGWHDENWDLGSYPSLLHKLQSRYHANM